MMITVNEQLRDSSHAAHPNRRYTFLTLVIVAMVSFTVGGALFGTIAKLAWKAHANGWEEIAMGYKSVSASCVSVGPNTTQPMQESGKTDTDPSTVATKPR